MERERESERKKIFKNPEHSFKIIIVLQSMDL